MLKQKIDEIASLNTSHEEQLKKLKSRRKSRRSRRSGNSENGNSTIPSENNENANLIPPTPVLDTKEQSKEENADDYVTCSIM